MTTGSMQMFLQSGSQIHMTAYSKVVIDFLNMFFAKKTPGMTHWTP
jgi:hypothetical protein